MISIATGQSEFSTSYRAMNRIDRGDSFSSQPFLCFFQEIKVDIVDGKSIPGDLRRFYVHVELETSEEVIAVERCHAQLRH